MGHKKKILIVDDEPKIRALFRRCLKKARYQLVEAEDGDKALVELKRNKDIDLIILDINLPKMSGLDVFEKIKATHPWLKIIIASVYRKDEQEFFIWDADDYYYKSESISVLIDKVNNLFSKNSSLPGGKYV